MSGGGMVQILKADGWSDCFPVGDKPHNAVTNTATKYRALARLVNRRGIVLFTCDGRIRH